MGWYLVIQGFNQNYTHFCFFEFLGLEILSGTFLYNLLNVDFKYISILLLFAENTTRNSFKNHWIKNTEEHSEALMIT